MKEAMEEADAYFTKATGRVAHPAAPRHEYADPLAIQFTDPPPISRTASKPSLREQYGLGLVPPLAGSNVILESYDVDPNKMMFEGIDTTLTARPTAKNPDKAGPSWTIGGVAQYFFGKSAYWIRWMEREKSFTLNGKPIDFRRKGGANGSRYYYLSDIELMVHALAEQGRINDRELHSALRALRLQGIIHGYLEEE